MVENRIGSERIKKGLSQKDLAIKTGVSTKSVQNWERDAFRCPPRKLNTLADMFGCTVDYLLGRSEDRLGTFRKM